MYDTSAYLKVSYYYERYIDQDKLKICKKWCNDFNYANGALREIVKQNRINIVCKNKSLT